MSTVQNEISLRGYRTLATNQIQRKKNSCKAILLSKGEMTFQLSLQTDKHSMVSILGKNSLKRNKHKKVAKIYWFSKGCFQP